MKFLYYFLNDVKDIFEARNCSKISQNSAEFREEKTKN